MADPTEEVAPAFNGFAIQRFYLLPIEATADEDTADNIAPKVLGWLFLFAMSCGLVYTIYFVVTQAFRFAKLYHDYTESEERTEFLEELGKEDAKKLSLGHLRILSFAFCRSRASVG